MNQQAKSVDVLIVGSGAAGLTAAIRALDRGLRVLLVEKSRHFGGSTARSGGWLWVPGTHLAQEAGYGDDFEKSLVYLRDQAGPWFDEERARAFLSAAGPVIRYLVERTEVRFELPLMFPDYHAEAPGGSHGGRSILVGTFDGTQLGQWRERLSPLLPELSLWGLAIGSRKEIDHFMRASRSLGSLSYVVRRIARHFREKAKYGHERTLSMGHALAGALMHAALERGLDVLMETEAQELLVEEGRVVGARVLHEGKAQSIHARHGVVLASGGAAHSAQVRALYPHASAGARHWSLLASGNTGDGARMAQAAGGHFTRDLKSPAAWVPVSVRARKDGSEAVMPHFFDRCQPGFIMVDGAGHRFVNESRSYHDVVGAMIHLYGDTADCFAWLVTDHKSLRRYGLGMVRPAPFPFGEHLASGYLVRGGSVAGLAQAMGVDARALQDTIKTFNESAVQGRDPQFGRGTWAYNRAMGDSQNVPNPNVRALDTGPYYAIRLYPGDLATFVGLRTDARSRVLNALGEPVRGLYAAGNDAATPMGGEYVGAGATLGPAVVFGFIAGDRIGEPDDGAPGEASVSAFETT